MTSPERSLATIDLDAIYDLARTLGAEAGELIAAGRERGILDISTKSDPTDVVTAMDGACERLIRNRLAITRPDDGVHGEEHDEQRGTSGVRWIIDPIDGTVNYLYGLPDYAVSIAVEIDGELVVGVVTKPSTGQQFHARVGHGSYLDDRPLVCAAPPSLSLALVATGFGYLPGRREHQGEVVGGLLPKVRDVRRLGSAALDLCNVAAGRVDAYYEWGTHIWDWAAGVVICREAGVDVQVPEHDEGLLVAAATSIATELNEHLNGAISPAWGVPR